MEQVFDFREFMLTLLKKCKLILILALVFCLLGGAFGYLTGRNGMYRTTSGASVSIKASARETAPLTDTMNSINAIVSDNFFYQGLIDNLREVMTPERFIQLVNGKKNPKLSDLKEIISTSVKGNLIMVTVQAENQALTQEAGHAGIQYAVSYIPKLNQNVDMVIQDEVTIDVRQTEGGGGLSNALKYGILGLGGGVVLGILWIFFVGVFDLKVRSGGDLRKYAAPMLGELPGQENQENDVYQKIAIALTPYSDNGESHGFALVLTGSVAADRKPLADGLANAFAALGLPATVSDLSKKAVDAISAEQLARDVPIGAVTLFTTQAPLAEDKSAMLLTAALGGALLVERRKLSRTDEIDRCVETLDALRAKPLGFVLTD